MIFLLYSCEKKKVLNKWTGMDWSSTRQISARYMFTARSYTTRRRMLEESWHMLSYDGGHAIYSDTRA